MTTFDHDKTITSACGTLQGSEIRLLTHLTWRRFCQLLLDYFQKDSTREWLRFSRGLGLTHWKRSLEEAEVFNRAKPISKLGRELDRTNLGRLIS